ncbi:hypothetical protein ZIOFF_032512 [Zingiber officinale]|uniref:Uncharacterized protein n=1 Tax=Zingiber officinale TaxID=94328 RepID=A0A8J5LBM6_ZINOF|nr:hypothetical protein ZIOFF_032512 [Zingiber officinale]
MAEIDDVTTTRRTPLSLAAIGRRRSRRDNTDLGILDASDDARQGEVEHPGDVANGCEDGVRIKEVNLEEAKAIGGARSAKGPAFIVERIELLDLGVDQSFNVPTISSGWLAGSGWGKVEVNPLIWRSLSELLKQVIFSKHALLNMLVTYWSHFLDGTDEYLKSILYSTILCHSSSRNNCKGRVNIKYYIVPGYKKTGAAKSNKDRCADDKLKKMALRVIAESLSEEEIAGLKEAIPCDPPFEIPEGPSYTCRGRRRHF